MAEVLWACPRNEHGHRHVCSVSRMLKGVRRCFFCGEVVQAVTVGEMHAAVSAEDSQR